MKNKQTVLAVFSAWERCKTPKQKLAFIERELAQFEAYMADDEEVDSKPAFAFAIACTWFVPWLTEQAHKYEGLCK